MLEGEYKHTVDAKGRFFFPAQLKEEIGERPQICRGTDRNLMVYSRSEWEKFSAHIQELPFREAQKMTRYFISKSGPVSIDPQGRMVIPQEMREYAGIEKNIVIAGAYNKVEIWDADLWEKENGAEDETESILDIMERNRF